MSIPVATFISIIIASPLPRWGRGWGGFVFNVKMTLTKTDLAILDKFDFDVPPVGVKFLAKRPDMVQRLTENMALCEMLKKAQEGDTFFADQENHTCEAGLHVLGQADASGPYVSGEFGAGLKIFEGPRAASRLYRYLPRIGKGVANYVAFSPLRSSPLTRMC